MSKKTWFELEKKTIERISVSFIGMFAQYIDLMGKNDGRFPTPKVLIEYFDAVGLDDWSDYYSKDTTSWLHEESQAGVLNYKLETHKIIKGQESRELTEDEAHALLENVVKRLNQIFSDQTPKPYQFIHQKIEDIEINSLDEEAKKYHREFWLNYTLSTSNYLSIAVHGKTINSLVKEAIVDNNADSMLKAVQIDPTLIRLFIGQINKKQRTADIDFIDKFSYRIKNPTLKGEIDHPLLWVLFQLHKEFGKFCPKFTNAELLIIYNKAIKSFPNYYISDVQIVQRQKKRFKGM